MRDNVAEKEYNQKVFVWFGVITLLLFFTCGGLIVASFYADRQAGRFPGAEVVSSHNNYSGLPYQFRWDDTYAIDADFRTVYQWYSTRFDLGSESAANGGCVYAETYEQRFVADRYVGVLICDNPRNTLVFLNRTTSLNR
ncbi:MAG: hypothetical protein KDE51_19525 [Anaerolineales bacterium]|nr:hypothetical protein [Anaerolineales bacterium]